jgi:hypothetical protein
VVFGAIFLVAFGLGSEKHPVGATIGLVVIVAGVVGGIYPAAFSYGEYLLIRNPFRRIEIAWPRVESITARLSTVVETVPEEGEEGKAQKFTIWAVPVSMHERRKADRAAAKQVRQIRSEADRANRGGGAAGRGPGGAGYGRPPRMREDPVETMAFADQAVVEMKDRKRICSMPAEQAAPTKVTWTWFTLAPFVVSVGLLVAAMAGAF